MCVCPHACASSADQIPEGIRELEGLQDNRDLVVCAPLLLVHAHKRCKLVGQCQPCIVLHMHLDETMTVNFQIAMPFTALNLKFVASDRIAERR